MPGVIVYFCSIRKRRARSRLRPDKPMVTCDERNRAAALHGTGAAASGRRLISGELVGGRRDGRRRHRARRLHARVESAGQCAGSTHAHGCSRSSATPLIRGLPEIVQVQSSWSIGAPNVAMQATRRPCAGRWRPRRISCLCSSKPSYPVLPMSNNASNV